MAESERAEDDGEHTTCYHGDEYTTPFEVISNPTYTGTSNSGTEYVTEEAGEASSGTSSFLRNEVKSVKADDHDRTVYEEADTYECYVVNPLWTFKVEPVDGIRPMASALVM